MTAPMIEDGPEGPPCRLLKLCCELRDIIYSFALVDARPIQFKKDNNEQPGLLRVNKQIRAEATPLYYRENIFHIDCDCYIPTGILVFQRQSKRWLTVATINKKRNLFLAFRCRRVKWANVLLWAKGVHDCTIMGGWDAEGGDQDEAIARIIRVAADLRDLHVPWEKAVLVLEQMRKVAACDKLVWTAEESS